MEPRLIDVGPMMLVGLSFPHAGLATQVLPEGEWARFVHKGLSCELGLTLNYIFYTWLPHLSPASGVGRAAG